MSKRLAIVAVAATGMMGFAVSQAPAGKKHSHATIEKYATAPSFTAPGGVGGAVATCPPNSVATGGGADYVSGIARVQMGFLSPTQYYILVDNTGSAVSAENIAQVACTAGTSRVRGRALSAAAADETLDRMVADVRAAHRSSGK